MKRGSMIVDKIIKWIIALLIIAAVGLSAQNMIGKYA